ncbi:MAG: hypothetical protein ACE5JF_11245 [Anaerolineales bacterium]
MTNAQSNKFVLAFSAPVNWALSPIFLQAARLSILASLPALLTGGAPHD